MKDLANLPLVCSLTTRELHDRVGKLLAQFRSALVETEELQDGYTVRLPGDADSLLCAGNVIVAERECCPFLAFELVAEPNKGPVIVRVTGPSGTKEFLRTILWKEAVT